MSEIINTTTETAVPEQKSLPHMENILKAAELFSMRDFFLACTLSPEEAKPEPEITEKPSFAKPVKGIRRVG